MARPNSRTPDTSTYAGRVCARLRELRIGNGWTMEDFRARLAQHGHNIPLSSCYAFERGSAMAGGSDLPLNLFPVVARIYGYTTSVGWLPKE